MARELGHLRGRHRADAVAAVDEHEPLAARDPVPPQAQRDLLRERARRLLVRRRRRRAEHERPRARDVPAHVRVRAADVTDDEIVLAEMLREPAGVDDRPHSAATIPTSAAIAGRCSSRASQSASEGKAVELDAEHVARAQEPRDERDVREPVLRAAEVRPLAEQRVEPAERGVERLGRAVLPAPKGVVGTGQLVVAEDEEPNEGAVGGIGGQQRRLRVALLEELHDHRRLRQRRAVVLLDHRDTSGRVLLVEPGGPVGEVDLDGLVLDALLGEDDPDPRDIGTACGVVERDHGCTPITVAICSYSSWAGGSSPGEAAVRATSRTRLGSAPVSRPTTVAFAPSA